METSSFRYTAFGLSLDSSIELPGLVHDRAETPADVVIRETEMLCPEAVHEPRLLLTLAGVAEFSIENGSRVCFRRAPGSCMDYVRLFLLGSVLGAVLQQRGSIVLHGNAFSFGEGDCRVVVGHSGAGKSTLAAWYLLQGAEIVSDDICAIHFDGEGRPWVAPGIPQLKLWQHSADLLRIPTEGLRRIRPGFEKFRLPLSSRHARRMRLLTEIHEIDRTLTESFSLVGVEKVKKILAHGYRPSFVRQMGLEASYVRKVMGLAPLIRMQSVPRRDLDPNRA